MADFCKQCSIDLFGEDFGELANLGPEEDLGEGQGWSALCETCGGIVVSQDGECIASWCRVHGQHTQESQP